MQSVMAWKCLTFSFWLLLRRFCGSSSIEVVGRGREEQKKTQEKSAPMGLGGARAGLRRRHPPHFRRPSLNRSSGTDHGLMHLASLSLRASQTTRIFYHCGYRTDGIFRKCLGNIELKLDPRAGEGRPAKGPAGAARAPEHLFGAARPPATGCKGCPGGARDIGNREP